MSTRRVFLKRTAAAALVSMPGISLAQVTEPLSGRAEGTRVLIIPHTHWEGAIFKTREEYLAIGLPNIVKALYLLKKYPDYRFVLDQMCYVRPFLERYPSEVPAFRRFLAEGRLQIAGGTDTMHDNNMPSGESIARQFLLAKSFFREQLSYEVTTGWALDTFGHNAQMPQILKLAGMKSYWFMRGVRDRDTPTEFLWQGLDGTQVPAFWLPLGYEPLGELPGGVVEFDQLLRSRWASLDAFRHGAARVLLAGADVSEPAEALPALVEQFNQSSKDLRAQLAVPADFEAIASRHDNRPIVGGEFNPVGQGIYSSRIELKQVLRHLESQLITAEKLTVIAMLLGKAPNQGALEEAWEAVLFNEEHDPAAGSVVDKVYAQEQGSYERARLTVEEQIRLNFDFISGRVDSSGDGVPVMIFNSLAWQRTDVAQVDIPFSQPGVHGITLFDDKGDSIPIQFLTVLRNDDGGIRQARITFIARNIPAMGYVIFHAVPNHPQSHAPPVTSDEWFYVGTSSASNRFSTLENDFYRVSFDLTTGAMTGLVLKENDWEVLAASGNVVAQEYDSGDFWNLHGQFNGDIVSAKTPVSAPRRESARWSDEFGGLGVTVAGPVYSEYATRGLSDNTHPFGKNQFATRVRIYHGIRRIDISTELVNHEEFVRYRVVFPTTIAKGIAIHEIPFGAIERAQSNEFPAQNWIDYGDGQKGLTLINRGLPGNNVEAGKLMLSLMRSARMTWPLIGGNEPGIESDSGLGVGGKYTLDYALVPHAGAWCAAAPWRSGMEFNNPLIAHTVAAHSGELPRRWGALEVSGNNVVVSALKPGKNGTIVLRVYEATGKPAPHARVTCPFKIGEVREANLIEDEGSEVLTSDGGFGFSLRPCEIKTFVLQVSKRY